MDKHRPRGPEDAQHRSRETTRAAAQAIAGATLVHEPDILILEAINGATSAARAFTPFRHTRRPREDVVLSSHIMEEAEELAETVC